MLQSPLRPTILITSTKSITNSATCQLLLEQEAGMLIAMITTMARLPSSMFDADGKQDLDDDY